MPLLSEEQCRATFGQPMEQLGNETQPPFDFWPYFEAIPTADFGGFDCSEGAVDYVWRGPTRRYQHVLVNSSDRNVFMVVILDTERDTVLGHRLLDLKREYGLRTQLSRATGAATE